MITLEKIRIYRRYEGDIDSWVRSGRSSEKKGISESDWYLIESLIQDILISRNGLAADHFVESMKKRLAENCDGDETIKKLETLSMT